jgi:phage tail-like protein
MVNPSNLKTSSSNPPSPPKSKPGENYITSNRFYVEMGGSIAASFTECSGISVQVDKEVYLEGGVNDQQRIFLKQTKFQDITLKRGMTNEVVFWEWMQAVLDLTGPVNKPNQNKKSDQNKQPNSDEETDSASRISARRNLTILLFNQAGQTMQAWKIIGAIPVAWKTPTLQASGNAVAIEELTIAYEGLKIEKTEGNSGSTPNVRRGATGYFS